jgi:hypothetical protein
MPKTPLDEEGLLRLLEMIDDMAHKLSVLISDLTGEVERRVELMKQNGQTN